MEFFSYMLQRLKEEGENINVFGGGGGTITDNEIAELEQLGVTKIFSVEDGRQLGLSSMIEFMVKQGDVIEHDPEIKFSVRKSSSDKKQ